MKWEGRRQSDNVITLVKAFNTDPYFGDLEGVIARPSGQIEEVTPVDINKECAAEIRGYFQIASDNPGLTPQALYEHADPQSCKGKIRDFVEGAQSIGLDVGIDRSTNLSNILRDPVSLAIPSNLKASRPPGP